MFLAEALAADVNQSDKNDRDALWWSASEGHFVTSFNLVTIFGLDPTKPDNEGVTPIEAAQNNGNIKLAKKLQDWHGFITF